MKAQTLTSCCSGRAGEGVLERPSGVGTRDELELSRLWTEGHLKPRQPHMDRHRDWGAWGKECGGKWTEGQGCRLER